MDFQTSEANTRQEIRDLERLLNEYTRSRDEYTALMLAAAKLLRALKPPFTPGERVRPIVGRGRGSVATVDAIERAFGDWVVLLHFPSDPNRQYTYPAHDLEVHLLSDEVPF